MSDRSSSYRDSRPSVYKDRYPDGRSTSSTHSHRHDYTNDPASGQYERYDPSYRMDDSQDPVRQGLDVALVRAPQHRHRNDGSGSGRAHEEGTADDGNQIDHLEVEGEAARADVGSLFVGSSFVTVAKEIEPHLQPKNRIKDVTVKGDRAAVSVGSYAFGSPN